MGTKIGVGCLTKQQRSALVFTCILLCIVYLHNPVQALNEIYTLRFHDAVVVFVYDAVVDVCVET